MSLDPMKSPEILRLLAAADNARALVDQTGGGDALAALDGIYRDLGRVVHRALGTAPPVRPSKSRERVAPSLPPGQWLGWAEDIDEDEPTVIDRPDEDEDAGIVTRRRFR